MSGEEMQVPEDVYVSVVENLKIDLQNARNERDRAWAQRDEARAEIAHLRRGIEAYQRNWKSASCCFGECECEFDEADDHEAERR